MNYWMFSIISSLTFGLCICVHLTLGLFIKLMKKIEKLFSVLISFFSFSLSEKNLIKWKFFFRCFVSFLFNFNSIHFLCLKRKIERKSLSLRNALLFLLYWNNGILLKSWINQNKIKIKLFLLVLVLVLVLSSLFRRSRLSFKSLSMFFLFVIGTVGHK